MTSSSFRIEFRSVIHFLWLLEKTPCEAIADLQQAYGKDSPSYKTVYNWFHKFDNGEESLDDEKHIGRRVDSKLTENIKELIEDDPCLSAREIGRMLEVSHVTVSNHLINYLHLKRVSIRWVPHDLSKSKKMDRIVKSKLMLKILKKRQKNGFNGIITGVESWFYLNNPTKFVYIGKDEERPTVPKKTTGSEKIMISVFFSIDGFHLIH